MFPHFKNKRFGFTMTELIVSMAIMTIVYGIILGSRDQYSERLILKNEAYNLALYLRQAQVYSLGVKGSGSPTDFTKAYGVSVNAYPPNTKKEFYFFTDNNSNGIYDSASDTAETVRFAGGTNLRKLCATDSSGTVIVAPNGVGQYGNDDPTIVNVSFIRPSPRAQIQILNKDAVPTTPTLYPPVYVMLQSSGSARILVKIGASGEVAIIQPFSPCN